MSNGERHTSKRRLPRGPADCLESGLRPVYSNYDHDEPLNLTVPLVSDRV